MRQIIWAMFLTVLLACPALVMAEEKAEAPAAAAAVDPARVAAAKDLMEVTGVVRQFDGMMAAMSQGVAKGAKADSSEAGKKMSAEFDALTKRFEGYKADMMNDFAALYAETFTAEEMKAVADFYRSGTGAKFISMTPQLMQKGASIGMKYSEKMIQDIKAGQAAAGSK